MTNPFLTEVKIDKAKWEITYKNKVVLMGSCFVENIGGKLNELKFDVDLNPFGIIYNPMSVSKSLSLLMSDKSYSEDDLFEHKGVWGSLDHHSRFSSLSKKETLSKINTQLDQSGENLKTADFLMITFGTSWVYSHKKTDQIVSNCHKFPAGVFNRFRLTVDEIVNEYEIVLQKLWNTNPEIKVLFTVSPIRHWKDGANGNQLSKATLLLAVDQLVNEFKDKCAYFPSYEIVMDELRDYRFYAEDMIHLSSVAVDYIWNKFSQVMIAEESLKLSSDIQKIRKAMDHRPFNPASEEYRKFINKNMELISNLEKNYPHIKMDKEKEYFTNALSKFSN